MSAVAVTFTDTGDLVGRVAHGWLNGQPLKFATIVSTTGISTSATYFVVNRAADTFQVAATLGGAALGERGWFMGRSIQKRQAKGLTNVDSFEILRSCSIYRTCSVLVNESNEPDHLTSCKACPP